MHFVSEVASTLIGSIMSNDKKKGIGAIISNHKRNYKYSYLTIGAITSSYLTIGAVISNGKYSYLTYLIF